MTSEDLPPTSPVPSEPVAPDLPPEFAAVADQPVDFGVDVPPSPDELPHAAPAPEAAYAAAPPLATGWDQPQSGPIGQVRSTGMCILLYIVTLGIYGLYWWYQTHEEMKRHTGQGIGGLAVLLIGFFVPIVNVFLTPDEVGNLYKRRGQEPPVTALTGLWSAIGWIILVGPIVWFVKTNNALNDYWRSLGAVG